MSGIWGIVVAAGQGTRMGAAVPKQFLELDGVSILERTLQALTSVPDLAGITVVLPRDSFQEESLKLLARGFAFPLKTTIGGAARALSVKEGLQTVPDSVDRVFVHDGVRPVLSEELLVRLARASATHDAVVPGLPPGDTIKEVDEHGLVVKTLDRSRLVGVQTPQFFSRHTLARAMELIGEAAAGHTDCASMVEAIGIKVLVVPGDPRNVKITTRDDLWLLSARREASATR